ncbi:MAG: CDP-diacylglycerol--serine O-phosphatidyltransferase [Candidatus Hydrogenedentota bacterium]|nr:MAG: CDP-diacylglycerol--serine O-phosphatidyltransferase [Candidatus Hydrogenedentota bacterium]
MNWKAWIPNSLSLGNLSFGFLSMILASKDYAFVDMPTHQVHLLCGVFIILAALFDGLDGPMARLLKVESALGEQLDSLADLTTFGLAPAFLMYRMYFHSWENEILGFLFPTGMVIALIYPICAAYRLARFNVSHDPNSFTGLPSPIAGIFIAIIPIAFNGNPPLLPPAFATALFLLMAILMVSNIEYSKPQRTVKEKLTFVRVLLFLLILIGLILTLKWNWVMLAVLLLYIFSGIVRAAIDLFQKIRV